jgi:hypothetical protein
MSDLSSRVMSSAKDHSRGRLDYIDRQRWRRHLCLWLCSFYFGLEFLLPGSRAISSKLVRSDYIRGIGGSHA